MTDPIDEGSTGCSEYQALSRRQFVTGAATMASVVAFPAWLPKVVMARHYASARDVMVSVFQRGGADGLSICVPFGDAAYYTARPTIAIPTHSRASGRSSRNTTAKIATSTRLSLSIGATCVALPTWSARK